MTSDGIGQIWVSGVGVCSGSVKIGEDSKDTLLKVQL